MPAIAPAIPKSFDRYMEVFAGSACLYFYLNPESALLADTNIELMQFYRTLRRYPAEVYRRFLKIPRNRTSYYDVRATYREEPLAIDRAASFFYLNRNCFNGIYRTNLSGGFNVPYSEERVAQYPSLEDVTSAARMLRRVRLECEDFALVCKRNVARGDFVYLDPPYYRPRKRVFVEYSSTPFDESDTVRLQGVLDLIDRRGAQFLMSYPDCSYSRRLAGIWKYKSIGVRSTVAGNAGSRGTGRELLIANYSLENV